MRTGLATGPPEEVQDPFEILEGMRQIARADMMDNVAYISNRVERPRRTRAICRGHKACAIGTAWLAAGVPIRNMDGVASLPGVTQGRNRRRFLARRPALKAVIDVLNIAAVAYVTRHDIEPSGIFEDPIEALFESEDPKLDEPGARRAAMLHVIANAKRILRSVQL